MRDLSFYNAILERYSVRRYQDKPLNAEQTEAIRHIIGEITPLSVHAAVQFFQLSAYANAFDRLVMQGPHGQLINAPHVVLPYAANQQITELETGFQAQQFCVRCYQLGIGTCYIGTAGREQGIASHFHLPEGSKMGAAVVYGLPVEKETRTLANYLRKPGYRTRRKPLEEIFSVNTFHQAGEVPESLKDILLAAQRSPSATNAQPWHLLLKDQWLYLYTNPAVYPKILHESSRLTYALFDAGILMANVSLAYEAMDTFRTWEMCLNSRHEFPAASQGILPVAKIFAGVQ